MPSLSIATCHVSYATLSQPSVAGCGFESARSLEDAYRNTTLGGIKRNPAHAVYQPPFWTTTARLTPKTLLSQRQVAILVGVLVLEGYALDPGENAGVLPALPDCATRLQMRSAAHHEATQNSFFPPTLAISPEMLLPTEMT
jgi:hypothetical protein